MSIIDANGCPLTVLSSATGKELISVFFKKVLSACYFQIGLRVLETLKNIYFFNIK